jgi:glycosyltransferase domain-containing protein
LELELTSKSQLITVVIPSFDKQHILLESLEYWLNGGFKVIVLDGSYSALKSTNLPKNSDLRYFHMPQDFLSRLVFALKEIDTPYSLVVPDDELWEYRSVLSAIDHLENNEQVGYIYPRSIGFSQKNQEIEFCLGYNYSKFNYIGSRFRLLRLANFGLAYYPAGMYSVCRTEIYRKALHICTENRLTLDSIEEIIIELYLRVNSRADYLHDVVWFRNLSVPPVGTMDGSIYVRNIDEYNFGNWWVRNRFKMKSWTLVQELSNKYSFGFPLRRSMYTLLVFEVWITLQMYSSKNFGLIHKLLRRTHVPARGKKALKQQLNVQLPSSVLKTLSKMV